jgi:hypothetical protein
MFRANRPSRPRMPITERSHRLSSIPAPGSGGDIIGITMVTPCVIHQLGLSSPLNWKWVAVFHRPRPDDHVAVAPQVEEEN